MHEVGLRDKGRRTYKATTRTDPAHPPAEDLVRRNFEVTAPNLLYLPTKEGWLYPVVVLDLHSRLVVGCRWENGSPQIDRSPH